MNEERDSAEVVDLATVRKTPASSPPIMPRAVTPWDKAGPDDEEGSIVIVPRKRK